MEKNKGKYILVNIIYIIKQKKNLILNLIIKGNTYHFGVSWKSNCNSFSSSYPTIANVHYFFNEIKAHLKYCIEIDSFDQYELANLINHKIEEYWTIIDDATTIASLLDPWNKSSVFEIGEEITKAINALKEKFSLYITQETRSQPQENSKSSSSPREFFYQLKKRRLGKTTETSQASTLSNSAFTELDRYLALPCEDNIDLLLWWRAHSAEFPILSLMARDYLAIQATSVACEQAFSIAGNTITKTRNKLHPETARVSLCAKSWIDNKIGEQIGGKWWLLANTFSKKTKRNKRKKILPFLMQTKSQ